MDIPLVGLIAATCTTGAMIPQIIKIVQTKKVADISFGMYFLTIIGLTLWLIHGFIIYDIPLIVANIFSLSFAIVIFIYKLKYDPTIKTIIWLKNIFAKKEQA